MAVAARAACDTPRRMNTEYLWWLLALLLSGGGMVAFLALGRVAEIEGEPVGEPVAPGADAGRWRAGEAADGGAQSVPVSTTLPGPGAPSSTSDTP